MSLRSHHNPHKLIRPLNSHLLDLRRPPRESIRNRLDALHRAGCAIGNVRDIVFKYLQTIAKKYDGVVWQDTLIRQNKRAYMRNIIH